MLIDVARSLSWRRFRYASLWLFITSLIWLFFSSCHSVAPVVKIGLAGPFEGRFRDVGYDVIYSARLAIREVNNAGGIGGYRVSLVALDDFGDPEMAPQVAAALVIDEDVVAVLGHWLPETTGTAAPVYDKGDMPFVATDVRGFQIADPSTLPGDFQQKYAGVTPFDEVAGPYAGGAYDAMNGIIVALQLAEESEGVINRDSVGRALEGMTYEGMTGVFKFAGR
jgi:ABC-type branched-subunit amino acid transport system substrate-binding protein